MDRESKYASSFSALYSPPSSQFSCFSLGCGSPARSPASSAAKNATRIEVPGDKVVARRYHGRRPIIESANAIRIRVGQDAVLRTTFADVIHSFWIILAGKLDMIPDAPHRFALRPEARYLSRDVRGILRRTACSWPST